MMNMTMQMMEMHAKDTPMPGMDMDMGHGDDAGVYRGVFGL